MVATSSPVRHCYWRRSFSPLLVGSVVATCANWASIPVRHTFQSPIGRVSGCNVQAAHPPDQCVPVSVPYWSGQWLQPLADIEGMDPEDGFSPLLVGSVVATNGMRRARCAPASSFSPLLVGSVVATPLGPRSRPGTSPFQSPIGRVSGCNRQGILPCLTNNSFSPLLVGSVVATRGDPLRRGRVDVSVPYWSGQWLQLGCEDQDDFHLAGFSPLLVGSVVATGGRFFLLAH